MTTSPAHHAPGACTLPTAERPLRIAEFDELFRTATTSVDRIDERRARWTLKPDPLVAATAANLSARESRCCAFFEFAVTLSGGTVGLQVTVPDAYRSVLDALVDRSRAAITAGRP